MTCPGACDFLLRPPAPQEQSSAHLSSHSPLLGKNLPDSVREFSLQKGTFHRKVHYRRPKSVRSSGPIGARESARIAGNIHAHMTALERSDYPLLPPAPQEKKLRFSRVADIASSSSPALQNSRTILSESFPSKEALFPEKCTKSVQNPCAPLGL